MSPSLTLQSFHGISSGELQTVIPSHLLGKLKPFKLSSGQKAQRHTFRYWLGRNEFQATAVVVSAGNDVFMLYAAALRYDFLIFRKVFEGYIDSFRLLARSQKKLVTQGEITADTDSQTRKDAMKRSLSAMKDSSLSGSKSKIETIIAEFTLAFHPLDGSGDRQSAEDRLVQLMEKTTSCSECNRSFLVKDAMATGADGAVGLVCPHCKFQIVSVSRA